MLLGVQARAMPDARLVLGAELRLLLARGGHCTATRRAGGAGGSSGRQIHRTEAERPARLAAGRWCPWRAVAGGHRWSLPFLAPLSRPVIPVNTARPRRMPAIRPNRRM